VTLDAAKAVTASFTALSPASFSVTPATKDFKDIPLGEMSSPTTFTVQNVGQLSGTPGTTFGGTGASSFVISSNNCTTPLSGGATCTLGIVFKPASAGAKSATYYNAALSGTGSTTIYVNPSTGSDSNLGSSGSKLKTIKKAMMLATSSFTIQLDAGTYSTASGETFPITVSAGVSLIGNESTKGTGASPYTISCSGCGTVLQMSSNSTVAGVNVVGDTSEVDIAMDSVSGTTVRNNTVAAGGWGIHAYSSTGVVISGNVVSNMFNIGIDHSLGSAKFESNSIRNNDLGITVDDTSLDMGGGSLGSAGNNEIACNTGTDVRAYGTGTLHAQKNRWDHVAPTTSSTCSSGVDFCSSTVAFDPGTGASGPTLSSNPCP